VRQSVQSNVARRETREQQKEDGKIEKAYIKKKQKGVPKRATVVKY